MPRRSADAIIRKKATPSNEDPCWQIDGRNAFAVYCPWCGTKLPGAPFIEDAS
jgi:hypothetical protein